MALLTHPASRAYSGALGAFRRKFGTFQNWHSHVFSQGPPQLSEAPLLRWYSGTLPSSDPSWLWKRRTSEVADVPINVGRSPVSARAAEPESCASTQGNLRGGRSPHTSWLPRADLGCLPIVRHSGSTPGLEPQRQEEGCPLVWSCPSALE